VFDLVRVGWQAAVFNSCVGIVGIVCSYVEKIGPLIF